MTIWHCNLAGSGRTRGVSPGGSGLRAGRRAGLV